MTIAQTRTPANLFLNSALVAEARSLDINLPRVAEADIADALAREKERRWRLENAQAIESSNAFVDRNGLSLDSYRLF